MRITRRRMLLGLGTTAAVSGGVLGTGALTSVEAQRDIAVDVVGDGSAYVGLNDTSGGDLVSTNADGLLTITLDSVNAGTSTALATTTIDPAFTITNNSANTMYVQVDHDGTNSGDSHDVQFIGDDSASNSSTTNADQTANDVLNSSSNPAFIDRVDSDGNGLGDHAVTTDVHSDGSTTAIQGAGPATMPSGSKIDVVLQVASRSSSPMNLISNATIEAYSESGGSGPLGTPVATPNP